MKIQFTIDRSAEDIRKQAKADHIASSATVTRYHQDPESFIAESVREDLSSLTSDFQAIMDAFSHPESEMRTAAVFVAERHWPELPELISECVRLAFYDPQSVVRGVALNALSRFYGWIDDADGKLGEAIWCDLGTGSSQLAAAINQSASCRANVAAKTRQDWRNLIGPVVDQMLYDRTTAEAKLRDTDANVRFVALAILATEWRPNSIVATIAKDLALHDNDPKIRRIAVGAVSTYYAGTKDKHIVQLLRHVVGNERELHDVRFFAYNGLFQVHGMSITSWPFAMTKLSTFDPSKDINWSVVDRLCS